MRSIPFIKYEGLGNDFLVVETDDPNLFTPSDVASICHRRTGIGGDGILLVLPTAAPHRGKMRVLNADGSIPEMCGNGIRCVALHCASAGPRDELPFLTDAGERTCSVERTATGADVSVAMGKALRKGRKTLSLPGFGEVLVEEVNMGNPHAILLETNGAFASAHFDAAKAGSTAALGRAIETHSAFPEGTNVEFARLAQDGSIDLVVWERGVGFTLACGTGACATAAYACFAGLIPFGDVIVRLPGGALLIRVTESGAVTMRGPARRVFSGLIERTAQ